MTMSDISKEVARGVRSAIHKDLENIADRISELIEIQEQIAKTQRQIVESQEQMVETMGALSLIMSKLESDIKKLKETEIAKIEGKINHLDKYINTLKNKKKTLETRLFAEYERVREAYSKAVLRILKKFIESIKVGAINTKPLTTVLESYSRLKSAQELIPDYLDNLSKHHLEIYNRRMENISEARDNVIDKMEKFIEYRKEIAEKINNLRVNIGLDSPLILNIPFWVVGLKINGNEKIMIIPPMKKSKYPISPTKAEPYIEHLKIPEDFNFSEVASKLEELPEIVELARSNAVPIEKSTVISGLRKLKDEGYLHEFFINTIEKFWR